MQIRWSKTQNFAWEPGLSNSAPSNYVRKSGSLLLPQNAPRRIFQASFSEMEPDYSNSDSFYSFIPGRAVLH